MIDTLLQDLRYAVRSLASHAGFAAAAILTLAIGIGTNAAIFSVIDALLLRSLPFPNGDRLVAIHNAYPNTGELKGGSTIPDYLDLRHQAMSLQNAAIYQTASFNLAAEDAPMRLRGVRATPSLFSVLGTQPLLGRALTEIDGEQGQPPVAVISYQTWQDQFGGDTNIVGRDLTLDHAPYQVIGVMPQGFFFPDRNVQLWTQYSISAAQVTDTERYNSDVEAIGLLKADIGINSLEADLATIVARNAARSTQLSSDYATTGFQIRASALKDEWFGNLRPTLWLLQGMVSVVLLVSCINVVNLVLVRFGARRRDFALRGALGADRSRLGRQIAIESSLLALLGGIAGLLLAAAGLPLLGEIGFAATLRWAAVSFTIGPGVLAFALVLSLLMGLVLALATALALRRSSGYHLLGAGGSSNRATPASGRLRNSLVVGQFAFTLVLLVAAGLLLKSFLRLQQTDPGFVSHRLMTARLDLPQSDYADTNAQQGYYDRLLAAVRALPGVESASYTSSLPFDGHLGMSGYVAEAYDGRDANGLFAQRQSVDASYFTTLGMRLVEGRAFSTSDTAQSQPVVMVDETMARHLWPGRSAVGRRLRLDDDAEPWMTVIGVTPAVRQNDLSETPVRDAMYWPLSQRPVRYGELVVASQLPAASLVPALRAAAASVDPQLPIFDIQPLSERIARSLDKHRAPTLLLAVFGSLALLLAAVGIYGVLSCALAQRSNELGVRMAIGAKAADVRRLVIGAGMRLCGIGVVLGICGGLAIGRLLSARLYQVGPADAGVFATVTCLLVVVALVASWLPARRAVRIDPMVALRQE